MLDRKDHTEVDLACLRVEVREVEVVKGDLELLVGQGFALAQHHCAADAAAEPEKLDPNHALVDAHTGRAQLGAGDAGDVHRHRLHASVGGNDRRLELNRILDRPLELHDDADGERAGHRVLIFQIKSAEGQGPVSEGCGLVLRQHQATRDRRLAAGLELHRRHIEIVGEEGLDVGVGHQLIGFLVDPHSRFENEVTTARCRHLDHHGVSRLRGRFLNAAEDHGVAEHFGWPAFSQPHLVLTVEPAGGQECEQEQTETDVGDRPPRHPPTAVFAIIVRRPTVGDKTEKRGGNIDDRR